MARDAVVNVAVLKCAERVLERQLDELEKPQGLFVVCV